MPFKVVLGSHRLSKNVIIAQEIFGTSLKLPSETILWATERSGPVTFATFVMNLGCFQEVTFSQWRFVTFKHIQKNVLQALMAVANNAFQNIGAVFRISKWLLSILKGLSCLIQHWKHGEWSNPYEQQAFPEMSKLIKYYKNLQRYA